MKHTEKPQISRKSFSVQIFLCLAVFSATACMDNSKSATRDIPVKQAEAVVVDSTEHVQEEIEKIRKLKITYTRDTLSTKTAVDSFKTFYSDAEEELIYALNRLDARRLRVGDELIIPDTLTMNMNDYAPFPDQLEVITAIPKAVLISRRVQAVGLYENGKLKTWGPASTGKKSTPTPTGLYYGNYRSREKISTIDKSWIMPFYFNFMNYEGIGTHEYTLPGYPASHGCVRLRKEEAISIYDWADQWKLDKREQTILQNGTPFIVFGDYDHDSEEPWLQLAANSEANDLKASEIDILKGYVEQFKKDERNFAPKSDPDQLLAMPPEEGIETIQ